MTSYERVTINSRKIKYILQKNHPIQSRHFSRHHSYLRSEMQQEIRNLGIALECDTNRWSIVDYLKIEMTMKRTLNSISIDS